MNYIEVWIGIEPFSEDFAEQVMAQIEELPFESFAIFRFQSMVVITGPLVVSPPDLIQPSRFP